MGRLVGSDGGTLRGGAGLGWSTGESVGSLGALSFTLRGDGGEVNDVWYINNDDVPKLYFLFHV